MVWFCYNGFFQQNQNPQFQRSAATSLGLQVVIGDITCRLIWPDQSMSWIIITLFAQAIFAVVTLVDRFMVSTPAINKPAVYVFYNNILLLIVIGLLPFGVVIKPTPELIELSLLTGIALTFSLLFLYRALKISEASDVAPVFAAVAAIVSFGLSPIFLLEGLAGNILLGFILLVFGTLVMSYFRFTKRSLVYVCLAGCLSAFSLVFLKTIFSQTSFWNGIFWASLGGVAGVLIFLIAPSSRKNLRENLKQSPMGIKAVVILNKAMAGFAYFLVLYAVKLGSVPVVNALGGAQFVFLLFLALVLSREFPKYFRETTEAGEVLKKSIATAIIMVGLALLFAG